MASQLFAAGLARAEFTNPAENAPYQVSRDDYVKNGGGYFKNESAYVKEKSAYFPGKSSYFKKQSAYFPNKSPYFKQDNENVFEKLFSIITSIFA